ncbi:MAG TPA: ATP-dependent RNA helicase HrpA, partial [Gammaproteobacteria bacterium]|nr:ATP-dependent RNA helicase HrpA [Gammaproteobacteria bacterium]
MDCYKSKLEILRRQLPQVMLVDRHRLRRKLSRLAHQKTVSAQQYQQITQQISDSIQRYQSRQQHQPQPKFEQELPVISRKEDIAKAISQHQVTIISGETGSGKTTQIPQICLQLGLGCDGLIGHTQPRRIAARTVASRIAQELDTTLGDVVGYKVRFHDSVSADRS